MEEFLSNLETDMKKVDEYLLQLLQNSPASLQESLLQLVRAGGKRLRPAFTILAGRYGTGQDEMIIPLASVLELVHMASLIHDDVIDNSEIRRGKPTLRATYGNNFALHAGDYLLAKALSIIESYNNKRIYILLSQAAMEMCQGEIEQLTTAFKLDQGIKDYFYRIKRKTALLISMSCRLGAIAANTEAHITTTLTRYGHYIGMAFQIQDDILDYTSNSQELGKPVGSDINQGILTMPAIYALNCAGEKVHDELVEIMTEMKKAAKDARTAQVQQAIDLIVTSGAIEYSFALSAKYIKKGVGELEKLPAGESTDTLRKMAFFLQQRKF